MTNTYDLIVNDPVYFKQLAVNDMLIVTYKCPQFDQYIKVYNHYNQIGFTLKGQKILRQGNKIWTASQDKALFMRATGYSQELVYESSWEVVCFFFRDNILRQVFNEYRALIPHTKVVPPGDMMVELHVNETAQAFFYGMIPYFLQQPPPEGRLLELKFKELILNMLMNKGNACFTAYVKAISDRTKPLLSEIMEANFIYNFSLAEFARIAHLSLSSFKRVFTDTYHTTPGKWLMQKRLEHARFLLQSSDKNINEIAESSGFDNSTHFNRAFKAKYGLPPFQYRKQTWPDFTLHKEKK